MSAFVLSNAIHFPGGDGQFWWVTNSLKLKTALQKLDADSGARPQYQIRKIVVATDFSDHSLNALHYAAALAMKSEAELIIFNSVVMPSVQTELLVNPVGLLEKIALDRLDKLKFEVTEERTQAGLPEITISTGVRVGFSSENIIRFANGVEADLLVVGTHGVKGGAQFLQGNTSAEVARRSKIPVLAVPSGVKPRSIEKIVFAADLGRISETLLNPIETFANLYSSLVQVMHVIPKKEHFLPSQFDDFKVAFKSQCDVEGLSFHLFETQDNYVAEAIRDYAEFEEADLLVLTSRPRNLWGRLFHKSQTTDMCLNSDIPILILHQNGN